MRKLSTTTLVIWAALLILAAGCRITPPREQRTRELKEFLDDPHPAYTVKILTVKVLEGTEEESKKAEQELKDLKRQAYSYLGSMLEQKLDREKRRILINIMVAILLNDASSVQKTFREQAVQDMVNLDKRFGVIDQLLLRLESADQKLSDSIFKVLEERNYISARWSWPEQAWDELAEKLADNSALVKRYIVYKLGNLPKFDPLRMNWDEYDALHDFTVLSELAIGEGYEDLALMFVPMLKAEGAVIREQAAKVLGYLGYKAAAQMLTEKLTDDPSKKVKTAVTDALGRLKAEGVAAATLGW